MAKVFKDPRMRNAAGKAAWCLLFKGLDGKWHRERTDAIDRQQAEARLRERLHRLEEAKSRGLVSLDHLKPVLFGEYWPKYLEGFQRRVKMGDCRESTYKRKQLLAKHVLPFFSKKPLKAILAKDIKEFISDRSKATPTPSAAELNRERALVSAVLSEAFRDGLVDLNETRRVRPLKERQLDLWLKPPEIELIIEHAEPWVRPFISIGVHAGMREAEICNLRWEDLDHSPGWIRVGDSSKNHKVRFIPINRVVQQILSSQTRRIGAGGSIPWVFVNPRRSKPYSRFAVCHSFKRAVKAAAKALRGKRRFAEAERLEGATFHTTRHCFASWSLQAGIPIAEVQQYLGHSSDSMTRRYAHLAKADPKKRNSLDALISPQDCANVAKAVAPNG